MNKSEKSIIFEATMHSIGQKLSDLVIETHNTAIAMSEAKYDPSEIQILRNVADSISALEMNIRLIKYNQ